MAAPLDTRPPRENPLPLIVAVAAALAVTIWVSLHKSIWLDEVSSLRWTGTSLDHTLRMSEFREQKPPLYFVLLYFWRKIASGIDFSRGFSGLCVALSVVFYHRLSGLLGIGRGWLSLALVAALTPLLLWSGAEARPYALSALCIIASVYYATRVQFGETEHPWRDSAFFVLWGYAGLLTFYYTGFILAALFVAGLLGRDVRRLVWSGVALAVLMVPWLSWVRANMIDNYTSYLRPVELGGPSLPSKVLALLIWTGQTLRNVTFRARTPLVHQDSVKVALLLLLVGLVAARLWTGRPRWSRLETAFALFGLLGFGVLAVLRLTNASLVDERHWIVAVPGLIILPSLLASRVTPGWLRHLAGIAILATFALATVSNLRNNREQIDWRGPARIITQHGRPHEPIVLYDQDSTPFEYYYRGTNVFREVPYMPWLVSPKSGRGTDFPAPEIRRLRELLALRDPARNTFWLVEGEKIAKGVDVLGRQLQQPLVVLESWHFNRTNVYRVRLDPPAAPPAP